MLIKSCRRREKEGVDQRRSFSFNSLDFNSSFGPISTDEDESIVDQGVYSDDDDNDDAYIEINLDHPQQSPGAKSRKENEEKKEGDDDLEFRVSFLEAALPFIGISSPPSNTYSLPVDWPAPNKRKVPLFLPVNHLLNTLEVSPADDSIGDDHFQNSAISNDDSKQLVLSMNRNGSRTAADGGGMMNMMVKFRYVMSFRWMVASMLKIRRQQRQAVASSSPSSSSTPTNFSTQRAASGADSSSSRNQKMSKRLLIRRKKPPRQQVIGTSNNATEKSRSSVLLLRLGIKLDAIRGVVASDRHSGSRGGGKHSKSCPGSIKSSPLHHQGGATVSSSLSGTLVCSRDNSVQAAIAHCKKSFGRSEDFSF